MVEEVVQKGLAGGSDPTPGKQQGDPRESVDLTVEITL